MSEDNVVIWLIGLAGAGKTSIGRKVHRLLKERGRTAVFLDGDRFREVMGDDLGHSPEDREKNGWRICRLSAFLGAQGVDVVACVLSNFHDQQGWNRTNIENYFEVFVDVSLDTLEQRDQKGLYSGARQGQIPNVVGIDIPFTPPEKPDLVVRNEGPETTPEGLAEQIVKQVLT